MKKNRTVESVVSANIDVLDWDDAVSTISDWAKVNASKYICICNSHSVVTANQDPLFQRVVNEADLATPDGAPVAWMLRRLGYPSQQRINGPDLMWKYCEYAEKVGQSIFLYGGTPTTLETLKVKLKEAFPGLIIAGDYSPPFRTLTDKEDEEIITMINQSGAGSVWVSLGCPKQEIWMFNHRGKINAVMIGVGAAFDYHAGIIKRAPKWMQLNGLEWMHRLFSEPRRLWKRYLVTNTLFIVAALKQLVSKNA